MWMMFHFLVPCVEHAEEADLRAQMFGVACDFEQRFRTEPKQQVVDEPLVLQCERSQAAGQREDDVSVAGGQDLGRTRLDPALSGIGLALRAMPVTT